MINVALKEYMIISTIAATVLTFLAPYFSKGREEFIKDATKDLWEVIKMKFSGDKPDLITSHLIKASAYPLSLNAI